jgi:HK97 family phage major capsid protein
MDLNELKAQRKGIYDQMCALNDAAAKAGKQSADDQKKYSDLEADLDAKGKIIAQAESLAKFENEMRSTNDGTFRASAPAPSGEPARPRASKEFKGAFAAFLRAKGHVSGLNSQHLNVLQTNVDGDGGFLVPDDFESAIYSLLRQSDPIRGLATVMTLSNDRHMPVQTGKSSFGWLGENGAYPSTQPGVGRVTLSAHKIGGVIYVSDEMLQDSGSNVEQFLTGDAVQGIRETESTAFVNGDGAAKPLGIFATTNVAGTALVDNTGATSATATITADNLIDTFHTLAPQYRMGASWVANDSLIKLIRKLKGSDNNYLWQPGLTMDQPDRILGRPVYVSEFAPAPAVSTRSLAFGDFKQYIIADRLGLAMKRYDEIAALNGQVAFRVTKRTDARLRDARAVVFYKHGAAS